MHVARLIALMAALGAPAAAAGAEARAAAQGRAAYDGLWVIDATTTSFFCPLKRKQMRALVQNGRLVKLSGLPGSASGSVGADGGVALALRVFGYTAQIHGRLIGPSGQGAWASNSMICAAGAWTARAGR